MSFSIPIHGVKIRTLLDSGAQRDVLPFHLYDTIPAESKPPIRPSVAQVLQGIGHVGVAVLGEAGLPVQVGGKLPRFNFAQHC